MMLSITTNPQVVKLSIRQVQHIPQPSSITSTIIIMLRSFIALFNHPTLLPPGRVWRSHKSKYGSNCELWPEQSDVHYYAQYWLSYCHYYCWLYASDCNHSSGQTYQYINVQADSTLTATFAINTYAITPSVVDGASGHGTISPSSVQTVNYGATPTFTFAPDTGYSVSAVTVDGSGVTFSNNQYQFSAVSAAHTIAVTFAANPVTLTLSPGAGGSIVANPASGWHYGNIVTVTANPSTGYSFGSWGGALSGPTNPTTVTMTGDKTVSATFTINSFTITPSA